jgi:hypothetical protein
VADPQRLLTYLNLALRWWQHEDEDTSRPAAFTNHY